MVIQRVEMKTTPVTATAWRQHIEQHFGIAPEARPTVGDDGVAGVRWAARGVQLDERGVHRNLVALGRRAAQPTTHQFQLPNREQLRKMVDKHVAGMKLDSVAGPDGVPVPFIRNARVRVGDGEREHVLFPSLRDMFELCMRQGRIQESWKQSTDLPSS